MRRESARTPSSEKASRGFTDKLYIYNVIFVTAVVIISFIAVFMSGWLGIDTSAVPVIVSSAYGELAVHTGFVIWKAKCENQRKYKDVNGGGNDDGMDLG